MNYQKPQLTLMGSAISVIQADGTKDAPIGDNADPSQTVDAYVSDEA